MSFLWLAYLLEFAAFRIPFLISWVNRIPAVSFLIHSPCFFGNPITLHAAVLAQFLFAPKGSYIKRIIHILAIMFLEHALRC